ncbi:hypothetical protein EZS27_000900 [termite gut metagenome]|uniref:Uncharacterized protein n=1 Tax=termite gut metagenome TaxID=433724 RepID=A0A5J4T2V0_9ZZZZ
MEITELVWKLFLILMPGVIATLMVNQLSSKKITSVFFFIIYSALFGIITFIIMEILYSIGIVIVTSFWGDWKNLQWGANLNIWDNIYDNSNKYNRIEIFTSYVLSIPLGLLYGYIYLKKWPNKLFKYFKWTDRYGDDDVWSFYLNSPETDWVYVRERTTNLTYFGKIRAFSDSGVKREILLADVEVYRTDDGEKLYNLKSIFLELDEFNYSIESPVSDIETKNTN